MAKEALQWHMSKQWISLYAQQLMMVHASGMLAKMPPDSLPSTFSRALAPVLVHFIPGSIFPGIRGLSGALPESAPSQKS